MKKTLTSLLAVAALAACGGEQQGEQTETAAATDTTTMGAPAASAPTAPATGGVTDPQIAAIVVAANNVDIEAGRLATSKAGSPQVKEFANRMITDHTAVNKSATELVTRLGVTPEESPTSQQFTQGGEQHRSNLQGLSGAEFDRAYVDHEVTYHQQLLDAIDNTLIPSAQNADLKALLQQTRPAVEAHLQHAKQLQSSLPKS